MTEAAPAAKTWKTIDGAELKVGDPYWRPLFWGRNEWARDVEKATIHENMPDWYSEKYTYSTREAAYAAAKQTIVEWMEKQQEVADVYLRDLDRALETGVDVEDD